MIEDDKYINIFKLSIEKLVKLEKVNPELLEKLRGVNKNGNTGNRKVN